MRKTFHKRSEFGCLREFAEALNVPIGTLSSWVRHDFWRWPRRAPWPAKIVPDVLRWRAEELGVGRPPTERTPTDLKGLREQKIREEIRKLRFQADVAESELKERDGRLADVQEFKTW